MSAINVTLKPEASEFINEQVKAGKFHSADEVLGEALHRMMEEETDDLDDATIAAINRGDEQIDRGEGIDFDVFAASMRKKYSLRTK